MSDADVVRLVPLYQVAKRIRTAIIDSGGVYERAGHLEALIEQAILSDGKVLKLQAGMTVNDMLMTARLLVERIATLKLAVDEAAE